MLFELAIQEGVRIRYNSKVVHVDSETVSVALEDGERITSDVVIGADGFSSLVRTTVIGRKVPETRERDVSLSFTIPTDVMKRDEDLKPLTNNSDVRQFRKNRFMGRSSYFCFYFLVVDMAWGPIHAAWESCREQSSHTLAATVVNSLLQNSDRDFSATLGYTLSEDLSEYNEEWIDQYSLEHFNLDLQKFEPRLVPNPICI